MDDAPPLPGASQKPYQTNLLLAGYDQGQGPSLYWMDYLATMHKMNIAGTGYGAFVCIALQVCYAVRSHSEAPVRACKVANTFLWCIAAGSYFVLSLFDRLWKKDMTEAEALELMEKGVAEVKRRLVIAPPSFIVKVIDKDGIRLVKTL